MTDRDLAVALQLASSLEQGVRVYQPPDAAEQDAARAVLRHTVAQRVALERWIAARVVKLQLQTG
jgi:hypothetical protein